MYPTEKDKDGFYYSNEEEHQSGIQTRDYDNGSQVKKVTLSNGATAIIRKLKGSDLMATKKIMAARGEKDHNLFEVFNLSVGCTIDGQQQPPEYFLDDLYQSDLATLLTVFASLNF